MSTLKLEIKKSNEVLEIHKGHNGFFVIFGAKLGKQSNLYEMDLSNEDIEKIKQALSNTDL